MKDSFDFRHKPSVLSSACLQANMQPAARNNIFPAGGSPRDSFQKYCAHMSWISAVSFSGYWSASFGSTLHTARALESQMFEAVSLRYLHSDLPSDLLSSNSAPKLALQSLSSQPREALLRRASCSGQLKRLRAGPLPGEACLLQFIFFNLMSQCIRL